LYLWHFPLLVFCRVFFAPRPIGFAVGVAILMGSIALAFLTNRLLENPLRFAGRDKGEPGPALALGPPALTPVSIALALPNLTFWHLRHHASRSIAASYDAYPGARVYEAGFQNASLHKAPVFPGPFVVEHDRDFLPSDLCTHTAAVGDRLTCPMGNINGLFT